MVDGPASGVVRFKGVDQGHLVRVLMDYGPSAPTSSFALPVLSVVFGVLKYGASEVKINAVKAHQLGDQFGLSLHGWIVLSVAVDKAASLGAVGMEVDVHL